MTGEEVARFERSIATGGVALFPADTVYGLACDPDSSAAVERLYRIKGRPPSRAAAVMFWALDAALARLPDLGPKTQVALERLLPGPVTAVLANPHRHFPLACGPTPERLGIRVPALSGRLAPLASARRPVLQSSANISGEREARRLDEVDPRVRGAVDAELDGGELPGTPSTVIDLADYETAGRFAILREGALGKEEVANRLGLRRPAR